MSLVRTGFAGLGKFVVMTSAFCFFSIIAITGPPTPSETASLSTFVGRFVRRFDTAALDFTFDLCDSVPVAAHAAGLCATPAVAVAREEPRVQTAQVSTVSETLPPAVREILPPDTIDQIARPIRQRAALLGEGRPAPRAAPARSSRASEARVRSPRATAHRSTRATAAQVRRQHARPARARAHQGAQPRRAVRTTPVTAPRRAAAAPPAHPPPEPAPQESVATPAVENAPPPEPAAPAPEEHVNAPPEEHAPPPEQSDEHKQPSNPESDEPPSDDIKA